MYKNNDFIYEATVHLEQLAKVEVVFESRRPEYDAILTLKGKQFVVYAKSEVRNSNKGIVLSELDSLKNSTRKPIILIAKFLANQQLLQVSNKIYVNLHELPQLSLFTRN